MSGKGGKIGGGGKGGKGGTPGKPIEKALVPASSESTSAGGGGGGGGGGGLHASVGVAKLDEFTLVKVSPGVWRIKEAPEDVFLTVPAGGGEPVLSPAGRRYFSGLTARSRKRTRKMRR